jgi:peptide/nickel transport system permease protein
MVVGIGTELATEGLAAPAPAVGRRRALRLPRSPKIIVGLSMLAFFVLLAIFGPLVRPYDPSRTIANNAAVPLPPSAAHWLGTTQLQQDVFSQLLVGGGSMLVVALVGGVVATLLSVIAGVTAGYLGGLADDLLSMLANIFLVLPALPLLIILFGFLGGPGSGGSSNGTASVSTTNDLFVIGLIIAVTGWAFGARVLRAQTLSMRNRDYVDSAKIAGERWWRIIANEILPNLVPIVASSFLFTVLYAVGTYTALAFLGLVNPDWSWGGMLFYAQLSNAELTGYWWWFVPPGLMIALLGTSLVLLNFGIDEFINPRLRAAGLTARRGRRARRASREEFALTPVIRAEATEAGAGRPAVGAGRP